MSYATDWKLTYKSISLGYSAVSFMASYSNYPGGHALKALHEAGELYTNKKLIYVSSSVLFVYMQILQT